MPSPQELSQRIRQLEEELQKVTSNFNRALEQGKAVVYTRNFDSLVYDYMGESIKDITGYSVEEITPALFDSITISAEPQGELANLSLDEAYRLNRSGSVNRWIADTQIRSKSGAIKFILDMSTTLYDSKGHCYGTLGIFFDITERKRVEQELAKTTRELRLKNEEIELDLETAREIQMALLAHHHKHFPVNVPEEESKVRFYNFYIPTQKLSGDFFYVLPISDDLVGVLIGDVMGHGIRASLITAFLRGLMEQIMPFAHDPSLFLQKLNFGLLSVLVRQHSTSFVTAIYLTVDIKNKVLRYANAGHPEPLFVNRATGAIPLPFAEKRNPEPALGLLGDFPYSVATRGITHDDAVYLFTDGVYDVANGNDVLFGQARLRSYLSEHCSQAPGSLINDVLEQIKLFAAPAKEFNDDLCMAALHVVAP
jgi:serine phosphatase RsbU (regulator of sigma subunit)